jgi:NYN domain
MFRTCFIVDGFNLYHSVKDASRWLGLSGRRTKWLDLRGFCEFELRTVLGRGYDLSAIYYFSALAVHLEARKPDVTARHRTYIRCLEHSGVVVEMSRFKRKDLKCPKCGAAFDRFEEKETDVALSAKLLELLAQRTCECIVLVTGDTDLAPAVRTAQRLYPAAEILFGFPFGRKNAELKKLVSRSFSIRPQIYLRHQFPDPVKLPDGTAIRKPESW